MSTGNVNGGNNTGWLFAPAGGYTITANNGTYALTGQSAVLIKGRVLTASNGTYSLTGQTTQITYQYLSAVFNSHVFGFSPFAAVPFAYTPPTLNAYSITAQNGTYALTGQTATITYAANYVITAQNGTYALTGKTATITYTASPFIVIDTHDGDYLKKKFAEDKARSKRKKSEIIQAYERLVEGKPDVAEQIAAPYIKPPNNKRHEPFINYDKLLADVERAEQLWQAYIDMDDEEVLMLL
jgi:hypothetical protein